MVTVSAGRHRRFEEEPLGAAEYFRAPPGVAGPAAGSSAAWGPARAAVLGPQAGQLADYPVANGSRANPVADWPPDSPGVSWPRWDGPLPALHPDHPSAPVPRVRVPQAPSLAGPVTPGRRPQELQPGRWRRRKRDRQGCRGAGRQARAHLAHRTPGPGSTALGPAMAARARPLPTGSRRQADRRAQTERHVRTGPREQAGLRRTTAPAAASARHRARATVPQTAAAEAQAHPHVPISPPRSRATTAARVARPRHNSRHAPPRPAELIPARVTRNHRLCRPDGNCTRSLAPPFRALRAWDPGRRPVTGWLSSTADRQRSRSPTPPGKAARRTWARFGTARCRPCPAARLPR